MYTPNERSQIVSPDYQRKPYIDGHDVSQVAHATNAIVFGGLGVMAGRNLYQRGGTVIEAGFHGAYCAMRWKIWAVSAFVWVFFGTWMALNSTNLVDRWLYYEQPADFNGYHGSWVEDGSRNFLRSFLNMRAYDLTTPRLLWLLNFVLGGFVLAVMYNRNVQECFFKRRWLYKVVNPVEWATRWMPWWVVTSLIVVAPVLPYILYNQHHVIPETFLDR